MLGGTLHRQSFLPSLRYQEVPPLCMKPGAWACLRTNPIAVYTNRALYLLLFSKDVQSFIKDSVKLASEEGEHADLPVSRHH